MFTGIKRSMEIPINQEQLNTWERGELIQKVMPHLSPDQREFIMTGVTKEEWDETFGETITDFNTKLGHHPEGD
jgi:hypothetical protein